MENIVNLIYNQLLNRNFYEDKRENFGFLK